MIKKFTLSMMILMASSALFSCGRIVPTYEDDFANVPAVTDIRTTAVSEPAAETAVTSTTDAHESEYIENNVEINTADQIGAPEHINVDPYMPDGYELSDSCVIDGFETVMQNPELPTGCEITALAQTLNFYGFDIDKVDLCDMFMPIDINGYYSMNSAYLGDPRSNNGFGCNAPVITMAASYYFTWIGSDWYSVDLTGISLQEVFYQIECGRPVVVWSTIDQRETYAEFQFTLGCGEDFYFNPYQHCLTIYGYDYSGGVVYVADPLAGNVQYDMDRFERIYDVMGDQAVILCGNEESAGVEYSTEEEKADLLKKIQQNIQGETPGVILH